MNRDVARSLFAQLDLSGSETEEILDELDFMARYKYDHYEMYAPAGRFFEHLYRWLAQFTTAKDRKAALTFIRNNLVFISQREIQDLARFLYYDKIVPIILDKILKDKGLSPFAYGEAFKHFKSYLRKCLFIGLSDGAKIDFFRRHNIDVSQEQVLPYYRTAAEDYLKALRDETDDASAHFWAVFLIDDFTGSGYTLIRQDVDNETGEAKLGGSLERVYGQHKNIIDHADSVFLCEYVATQGAINWVRFHIQSASHYATKLQVLCPLVLPAEIGINADAATSDSAKFDIVGLCTKYYDSGFETPNTLKGGGIKFGYGGHGLPLVLYSNTPNNSLFLLWFNTRPDFQPKFTALFTRIDRHKPL
ncbi:MAG TPA: hypothetical protein VFO40_21095 [Chthoniobacterales bacterium]|nr:hypothetical protein [Chthoniobacterales bacterium]